MNYDACKTYLLSKPEVMEVYPFGSDSPHSKSATRYLPPSATYTAQAR